MGVTNKFTSKPLDIPDAKLLGDALSRCHLAIVRYRQQRTFSRYKKAQGFIVSIHQNMGWHHQCPFEGQPITGRNIIPVDSLRQMLLCIKDRDLTEIHNILQPYVVQPITRTKYCVIPDCGKLTARVNKCRKHYDQARGSSRGKKRKCLQCGARWLDCTHPVEYLDLD